jgi:8-oxo-dGTP pyrophosphatase MutT (NUDIX family)
MLQDFSPIQNQIISKLKNARSLRYGELYDKKIPNDLFNYHLQFLVKKDLLVKVKDGYALSEKGLKHVADPYPKNDAITSLFKINVITLVSRLRNGKIEILNQVRKSNPSYGKVGVPGGVVLKGEKVLSAAKRKLEDETGLEADFKLVGMERRVMYKKGEIFSDVVFPIAYSDKVKGQLIPETKFGQNKWVSIGEAIANESGEYDTIKSIVKVLRAIKAGKIKKLSYFYNEEVQSDFF